MPTLIDLLQRSYEDSPDRVVLQLLRGETSDTLTYRKLLQGAAAYALDLEKAKVGTAAPVAIILQHGRPLVEAFFGALLHGAIPTILPVLTEKLSPERYRQSLIALIRISQPEAIITYAAFKDEVEKAVRASESSVAILIASEDRRRADVRFGNLAASDFREDHIAVLQHSSGTTGLQKGVALSHRAILNQVKHYSEAIQMNSQDVVVNWLPLYHDMGLIAGFLMPILLGAAAVLLSPLEWVRAPYKLLQAVSHYGGTLSWLPNFAYNFCASKIRKRDLSGVDLSSWRKVINCSEPMRVRSHQMFFDAFASYGLRRDVLATCYAMAENVFAVTQGGVEAQVAVDEIDRDVFLRQHRAQATGDQGDEMKVLSAGKPIAGTVLRVVDEDRRDLPQRSVGEIVLKSDCMLTGYYNRKDLTAQAFHEGWYLTGDLGYIAENELYLTGRKKDLIIVGGKNIYPQDLEALASDVVGIHPGRTVAFGIFNEILGTEEVALAAESNADVPSERRRLAKQVQYEVNRGADITARYVRVVPRGWVIKTSSGKVARAANREKFLEEFLALVDVDET